MARRKKYYQVTKELPEPFMVIISARGAGRVEAERRWRKEDGETQEILLDKKIATD